MKTKQIVAYSLIGVGFYDLLAGNMPVLGDYLTDQVDAVLVAVGFALLLLV